jgi:hypothetical protein
VSQSLIDLIKAYGDARADWTVDKSTNRVPEALAAAEVALGLKMPASQAYLLPQPRGYVCAAGCGHGTTVHREHGCDVGQCECPAPYGRILPSAEAQ